MKGRPINLRKGSFYFKATFRVISSTKFLFKRAIFEIDQKEISQAEKKRKKCILNSKGTEFIRDVIDIIYKVVDKQMNLQD